MYLANRNHCNDSNFEPLPLSLTWGSENDASRTLHIPCSTDLETRFGPYNGCFVGFQGMPLIPAPTYAGGVPSVEGRAFKQRLHIPTDAVFRPALAALHLLHAAEDKRGVGGRVVIKIPWVHPGNNPPKPCFII